MNDSKPLKQGLTFNEALLLLFVGLKLADKIDWSWWWVLCPLWLNALVVLGCMFVLALAGAWKDASPCRPARRR